MGRFDAVPDVVFVPTSTLANLSSVSDPSAVLRAQVVSPFFEWRAGGTYDGGQSQTTTAITVVSALDEPVEAIAYHPSPVHGVPPVVKLPDDDDVRPPSFTKAGAGDPGANGWVDPAWSAALVSVGSWIVSNGDAGEVTIVLHLRGATSNVDILVGTRSRPRAFAQFGHTGPWNALVAKLYDPGVLGDKPDYDGFYQTYVVDEGQSDDLSGSSADGAVSFLLRAPVNLRQDALWHVILMVAPTPIGTAWP